MASNIVLNAGSGGSTLATEQNGTSEQYQLMKVVDGTGGAFTNRWAILASGAAKVDGSGAVQPVSDNGANLHVQGAAASGAAKAGNPLQVGGVFNTTQPTVTTGQAVESQFTARGAAIVASGVDTFHVTVDTAPSTAVTGTFFQATQPVSATSLPLPTGASTAAKQPALGTAGSASADVLSVQGVASMTALKVDGSAVTQPVSGTFWQATQPVSGTVTTTPPANASTNVAQINAVTPLMGNGVTGTGSQRVTIASDNTAFAVNATLSAETTKVIGTVTIAPPATAAGLTMASVLLAATNNLTSTKASAGTVYGIQAFGTGSAPYWLKLYNKASAPVIASDSALIVKRILVPANATAANGAGVVVPINDMGLAFSSGIAWAAVGLQADADTTNTAAAGAVNIDYK